VLSTAGPPGGRESGGHVQSGGRRGGVAVLGATATAR
jgi:hypothetical protein